MKLIHPDFAVLTGDIIYGYGSDIPRLKMQWNDFLSVYDSFGIPVFVAPGNHEMQAEDAPESGNIDAQRLYIMHLGRLYYAFAYDNSLFIILDTDIVGSAAKISGEQHVWLKEKFKAHRKFEQKLWIHTQASAQLPRRKHFEQPLQDTAAASTLQRYRGLSRP